ncbi:MAG TPA: FISUMP domain-containing protein [Fibrobacteria bacterium]|nr:FISUMP domain-containing protein [Fibrobacteria bacterium]
MAVAAALLWAGACQFSPSQSNPTMTGDKSVALDASDSTLVPDAVKAYLGDATLPASGNVAGGKYNVTATLDKALASTDTLELHLSKYGIVTTVVPCIQKADGSLVIVEEKIVRPEAGRTLIRRIDGTNYPKTPEGAIQAYAQALFANELAFRGFPTNAISGIDTAKVRAEAIKLAVESGKTLREVVDSWGLDMSYEQAAGRILGLSPKISSEDSAALFPPPPVRVASAPSLDGTLQSAGSAIGLKGSFVSDADLNLAKLTVLRDSTDVSGQFNFQQTYQTSGKTWSLEEAAATLQAVTAAAGSYALKITVTDVAGNSYSVRIEFEVKSPADRTEPAIVLISPSKEDSIVDNEVASFDVQVAAEDASGIDSVVIGSVKADKNDQGRYHRSIVLDTTGTPTKIVVQAYDKAGNSASKIVWITRKQAVGVTIPVIRIVSPESRSGTVLPFDSGTVRVVWTLVDKSGIVDSTVRIKGGVAMPSGDDSTWSADVAVPATGVEHTVTIEAKNSLGLGAMEYFTIVREKDDKSPVVVAKSGSRTVGFDSTSASASWVVTDNHKLASVSIRGALVALRADGVYSTTANLDVGENTFAIEATDSTGNTATDTITIVREDDKKGPSVQIVYPVPDLVLEYATASVAVRVKSDDPSGIDSVLIQKTMTDSVAGEYRREVAIAATGSPTTIAIRVVDKKGNATDTTIRVTRRLPPENVPPVMALLAPASMASTVLPFDSTSVVVRWKILDPYGVADTSVRINGARATKENDSVWSLRVPLKPSNDGTVITTVASNTKGWANTVLIVVVRKPDGVAPTPKPHGTNLKEVPFDSVRATIGWDVTDNHKLSAISINGKSIVASGTKSSASASLRDTLLVGRNVFRLIASDSTGNKATDSFVVVRLADKVAPKIVRTTVPASPLAWVKSTTVVYTITDNDTVGTVTINGVAATRSGNTFKAAITLEAGANPIVVVAKDRSANTAKDSINVTTILKDRDGNSLKFGRMPDGRMWTLQNLQTKPSASSVDTTINSTACAQDDCPTFGRTYSWAMAMDLPASCDAASCKQSDSLSHQGLCPSGWHVPTVKEWKSLVTAAAAGASDSIGMSRLMSTTAEGKWYSWYRSTCEPVSYTETVYSGTNKYGFTLLPAQAGSGGGQCGGGGNTVARYKTATQTAPNQVGYVLWRGDIYYNVTPKAEEGVLRCIAN